MPRLRTIIILFSSLTFFSLATNAQKSAALPNILWIVSEDNSPYIGVYGDSYATTPNIDRLAREGVLYENAFASAPVCAPARSTLITGVYPTSMGTENMRSEYPVPEELRFFPIYMRKKGYYTINNDKKDYNTIDQPEAWDEFGKNASYRNRKQGQPFFAVYNLGISHEGQMHQRLDSINHDPEKAPIPPYHPDLPEIRKDWAQYYDKISMMDQQVGEILQQLDSAGLAGNTIVFYYSDHGGVLGRSKRFMYESGLRIPLIIRFPEMYEHLAPVEKGCKEERLVSFIDFAPTVLSLAEIQIPSYMQGTAFLGKQQGPDPAYAFAFRGRMDERIDLIRSVRDKKFRYIRNYMPHKIWGQYIDYLWRAPSMRAWEAAYKEGTLNEVQARFWQTKPLEELYDVAEDPHNIKNLATDPQYGDVLKDMRIANRQWLLESKDVGFIPEAMMEEISKSNTLYDYARGGNYSIEKVVKMAELATAGNLKAIRSGLKDSNAIIRYWAATGCTINGVKSEGVRKALITLLEDPEIAVRIAAAEAMYQIGGHDLALQTLKKALESDNMMARVQALNVMDSMGTDVKPALPEIENLVTEDIKGSEYDKTAAKRIIDKLQN